jgi:hypothetical protein
MYTVEVRNRRTNEVTTLEAPCLTDIFRLLADDADTYTMRVMAIPRKGCKHYVGEVIRF